MNRNRFFFWRTFSLNILKIFFAMTLFFFLFYLFAPTPDLQPQLKEEIRESIKRQLPLFSKKRIEHLFSEDWLEKDASKVPSLVERAFEFPILYLFWIKHAFFEGFGRPLRYFHNKDLPTVACNLIPYFRTTLLLTFLGSFISILLSLSISLWHVNWSWNIALNQRRRGSSLVFKGMALLSNIPSCVLGIIFMFLLVSMGVWGSIWLKYLACGIIIGYSDGIFGILSSFLKDEFQTQYRKLYIPMSATRGSPNLSLRSRRDFRFSLAGKAVRNILSPLISIFMQRISILIGMTIIVEVIFNIDGLGFKSWQLLHNEANGDYFQVMGIFAGFALLWLMLNTFCNFLLILQPKTID